MSVRYTERPNNTPEQVLDYLRQALDVVDTLGPPDDLRLACFTEAVRLVSGKTVTAEQIVASGIDLGSLRRS